MTEVDQRIKDIKEISIAIDTWDDVFSDFDPRPLNERDLSEDFIAELKKRYRATKTGGFRISIYAPITLKDDKAEKTVVQRLKKHFKFWAALRQKQLNGIRLRGGMFVGFGIVFLGFLTLITYHQLFSDFAIEILGIVLMPLGWFGIWEGFSKIVDTSPKFMEEEIRFAKLAKAEYRFIYLQDPSST
jgi:hypothetical protein